MYNPLSSEILSDVTETSIPLYLKNMFCVRSDFRGVVNLDSSGVVDIINVYIYTFKN